MSASASSGTFSLICIVSFKTVIYWLTMNLPHRRKAGTFEIVFYFTSADVGQKGERYARALLPFIQDDQNLLPPNVKKLFAHFIHGANTLTSSCQYCIIYDLMWEKCSF